jgi:hypothetical protein
MSDTAAPVATGMPFSDLMGVEILGWTWTGPNPTPVK